MKLRLFVYLISGVLTSQAQDTLRVMHYNLLYYGNVGGCSPAQNDVMQKNAYLRTITRYVKPDIFTVNELGNTEALADSILNDVLNTGNVTHYKRAALTNLSPPSSIVNMLYYNSEKLTLYKQEQVKKNSYGQNLTRLVDIYTLYYLDSNLQTNQDTVFLTINTFHLHSTNTAKRAEATKALMDTLILKGPANYLLSGDFNVDSYQETSFDYLLNPPDPALSFNDPLNQIGFWHNNSAYAGIHTQSTRTTNTNNGCFNSGGLDDRFDMILASNDIITGARSICYVQGSYKALGQDGTAFNQELPTVNNLSVPDSVAWALFGMSDHLPVIMDISVKPGSNGKDETHFNPVTFLISNPAGNMLYVHASTILAQGYSITIFDVSGRKALSFKTAKNQRDAKVDVSMLRPGFYLMIISNAWGLHKTIKLIKS